MPEQYALPHVDLFFHENYRVPHDSKLGFFRMCARYGTCIYVQYYDMRLSLD